MNKTKNELETKCVYISLIGEREREIEREIERKKIKIQIYSLKHFSREKIDRKKRREEATNETPIARARAFESQMT